MSSSLDIQILSLDADQLNAYIRDMPDNQLSEMVYNISTDTFVKALMKCTDASVERIFSSDPAAETTSPAAPGTEKLQRAYDLTVTVIAKLGEFFRKTDLIRERVNDLIESLRFETRTFTPHAVPAVTRYLAKRYNVKVAAIETLSKYSEESEALVLRCNIIIDKVLYRKEGYRRMLHR